MAALSPAAQALLAYVRDKDYVTFAEMPKILAPHIPLTGPHALEVDAIPNLLIWMGMSEAWVATLNELFTAELLWCEPCSVLCYVIDGGLLTLPVAKRLPRGGYKALHWIPMCVRPRERVPRAPRQPHPGRRKREAPTKGTSHDPRHDRPAP